MQGGHAPDARDEGTATMSRLAQQVQRMADDLRASLRRQKGGRRMAEDRDEASAAETAAQEAHGAQVDAGIEPDDLATTGEGTTTMGAKMTKKKSRKSNKSKSKTTTTAKATKAKGTAPRRNRAIFIADTTLAMLHKIVKAARADKSLTPDERAEAARFFARIDARLS